MKNIIRAALGLVMALGSFSSAQAQEFVYVNIDFKDATEIQFQLADKPELTFAGDKFVITAGTEVAEYDYATVAGYHFTNVATAIDNVAKGSLVVRFADNENVVVEGNEAFTASLYDTAGRQLDRKASTGGTATLSLAGQTAGIYVVKLSDGKSFKFLKK